MQKTYYPQAQDIQKQWFLIDAQDQILGRIAVRAAVLLRGKHKPIFSPHMDTGDGVIIINVAKVKVTGRKPAQKVYRRFSGYPGGLREVTLETMLAKNPETVMRLAVKRMLPSGALGSKLIKKLKIYADDKHSHAGQKPRLLKIG
jgi:large subunit ribosomal protein L13